MNAVVTAARGVVGGRFRPHGRDPAFGLDCVGLVALALRGGGFAGIVPDDYALRGGDPGRVAAAIDAAGLIRTTVAAAGDVLLCASAAGQLHLAIDSGAGIIHADAVARRVVERPGPIPWPVLARWRLASFSGDEETDPWRP